MPIEQETCYLDWMLWLVVTHRGHQYFSAEADFTCPADAGGIGLEKSAFVRGALNRIDSEQFSHPRMSHIYQPVMLEVLLTHRGSAPIREIADAILPTTRVNSITRRDHRSIGAAWQHLRGCRNEVNECVIEMQMLEFWRRGSSRRSLDDRRNNLRLCKFIPSLPLHRIPHLLHHPLGLLRGGGPEEEEHIALSMFL